MGGGISDEGVTVSAGTNSYTVTGLSAETEYTFTITTLDKDGNATDSTVTVKIKTPAITVIYKETAASLTVGSKVTASDGKTYYVISNQLGTNSTKSSASASISARAAATDETSESDDESSTETTTTADLTDATSATTIDTGDEGTDLVIEKFVSDAYVRKFLKEVGITKYIQLYNADDRAKTFTENPSKDDVNVTDSFVIADENGNTIANFRQSFNSDEFVKYWKKYVDTSVDTENTHLSRQKWFVEKFGSNADLLRQNYNPDQFNIVTITDDSNLDKKYGISKHYNYDENGEVATTKVNLRKVNYSRHFIKIDDKVYNSYTYKNEPNKSVTYALVGVGGGENYNVNFYYDKTDEKYSRTNIASKGISNSDRKESNRKNSLDIYFNRIYTGGTKGSAFDVITTLSGESLASDETAKYVRVRTDSLDSSKSLLDQIVTVTVGTTSNDAKEVYADESNTQYTLGVAISTYLSDYIQFSSDTTTVGGYTVPAKIYARANFPSTYTEVAGHDFLNVELVPVAAGDDSFKYVGIYDSTTGSAGETTYSDAFDECVANETPMTESSYVPSFATLYADNIKSVADGTYTDKKENPFPATSSE